MFTFKVSTTHLHPRAFRLLPPVMPSKERVLVTFVVRRVEAFPCVGAIDEPRLLLHP